MNFFTFKGGGVIGPLARTGRAYMIKNISLACDNTLPRACAIKLFNLGINDNDKLACLSLLLLPKPTMIFEGEILTS
jgi:hypothetical protein